MNRNETTRYHNIWNTEYGPSNGNIHQPTIKTLNNITSHFRKLEGQGCDSVAKLTLHLWAMDMRSRYFN